MADPIVYASVRVDEKGIMELDHGRRSVFVPRENVRSIELKQGSPAERPMVQLVLGMIIFGGALYWLSGVVAWWNTPWAINYRFLIVPPPMLLLGSWLIYAALRKRYFLRICLDRGERKIVFRGDVDRDGLQEFMGATKRRFEMEIISRADGVWNT
ncbi:MAG: hypothetical protein JWQ98_2857 [Chlorobi bacterium]|nr:hypothetical protein [Chlorobiota bacterium]